MTYDVAIIGSGLVGSGFALAIRDLGLKIALVEPHPPEPSAHAGWDSRIYAVSPGSMEFLRACGAWEQLDESRTCPVEEMRVSGDADRVCLEFSAYQAGVLELARIIENRGLQQVLWAALNQHPDIEVFSGAACGSLEVDEESARVLLDDGRTLDARLVVAADGADSRVRAMREMRVSVRPYHHKAVVANFESTLAHHNIAHQWFRSDGVLALLPLPGRRVSMVWSTPDDHAAELMQLSHQALSERVSAASHGAVGGLEVITPPAAFILRLQRVDALVQPRIALIGDAAHNVHPLAGQGVNLGFRDARELARVLKQRGPQADCGDYFLLRRYERARKEDISSMSLVTDGLQRLFSGQGPWLAGLRNLGMRATQAQPWLKNLLVRHAVA